MSSLAGIVARWEWRTFGESFGDAEERLAAMVPDRVQESDELYLLSLVSDASVKVRDELMDVKQLERVSDEGLEQWRPVMKAVFPLAAADVLSLLSTLGVEAAELARESYSRDQLVEEVVPSAGLLAVVVHKQRSHFKLGGCMAELTAVGTEAGSTRTIAIESEDSALVTATVHELGLEGRPNVCVARGLKQLVGFRTVRYAVIDVGTNSVKFHLGERLPEGGWRTIADRAEVTRLGQGLAQGGRLESEPVARTVDAIVRMVDEARRDGVAAIAAVGTAGMRIASNSSDVVDAVEERCGVRIEVISGEEEARLAYLAATSALDLGRGSLVVFDTGGGSSQFTFGVDSRVAERFSVDVGVVRFTERFRLDRVVDEDVLRESLEALVVDLAKLDGRSRPDAIVGLGGTVTNLAAVKHGLAVYDADVVQGTVLDRAELERQIELYRTRSAEERRTIAGLQPKRAEVILAGACVVRTVLEKLDSESLVVSDRGLRHGVLVERFGNQSSPSRFSASEEVQR